MITLIIISSLVSVGFYAACQFEGDEAFDVAETWQKERWPKPTDVMILWFVRYYGGQFISKYWSKPVYSCLPCMGSLHSIVPTLMLSDNFLTTWPLVAFATVGVNYLIQTVLWK